MKLCEIERAPLQALCKMDRLVNNGHPVDLHYAANVSQQTNPWLTEHVQLPMVAADDIEAIGCRPKWLCDVLPEGLMFVHPDVLQSHDNNIALPCIDAVPTASSRTLFIAQQNWYLKLHYPFYLGRVSKTLDRNDIVSSVEMTACLEAALERKVPQKWLSFLPEPFGMITRDGSLAFLLRNATPLAARNALPVYIVPAFSLFGHDESAPGDELLVAQLLHRHADNWLMDQLIFPIVDTCLSLMLEEGLLPEMHAQNFLIGFDKDWQLVSVILRDIESIQKDLTVRRNRGLPCDFSNSPHRCMEQGQETYLIRHSFMYDHKLGELFLQPLLNAVSEMTNRTVASLTADVQAHVRERYRNRLQSILPNGKWYNFENILIANGIKRRPFLEHANPIFR